MRTIKFRAWDGNKMIETGTMHDTTRGGYEMWDGENYEYYPVMQFTGLLDKNGKEIYEGDILLGVYGSKEVVEWGVEEVYQGSAYGYGFTPDSAKDYEIIGNIYENPDLLSHPEEDNKK